MSRILDTISSPEDLKEVPVSDLPALAQEIREELIKTLSGIGGHLAPNLGVVELTIALHRCFDSPRDKIVWDVGHQAYVHKMFTGRRERFKTIRQFEGLSGYCRRAESPHDAFGAGHGSTSISAALGFATARDLAGEDHHVVAVIGDGALSGGLALSGLNQAGHLKKNLIIVLNENEWSISRNVGAMAAYLQQLRFDPHYLKAKENFEELVRRFDLLGWGNLFLEAIERLKSSAKQFFVPGMLFEELGLHYYGPVDGHNIRALMDAFAVVKDYSGPVLVHVITTKGKGYAHAENDAETFHGCTAFEIDTGKPLEKKPSPKSYGAVLCETLMELAEQDPRVVAITAAMPTGTGLKKFGERFPHRFFDVGMTEEHAVTFAGGLAAAGYRPVAAIYSTFLQRAYDQVIHDVCIQRLPVVFCLDRAGLVGDDGATHHGVFDVSYLRCIPEIVVMAPKDEAELRDMIATALAHNGPTAIRYPRGAGVGVEISGPPRQLDLGRAEVLREGSDASLVAIGSMVYRSLAVAEHLASEGFNVEVINGRFIRPLDEETIARSAEKTGLVITVEESMLHGGFGSAVWEALSARGLGSIPVHRLGVPDHFIEHGPVPKLHELCGLDEGAILATVRGLLAARKGVAQISKARKAAG